MIRRNKGIPTQKCLLSFMPQLKIVVHASIVLFNENYMNIFIRIVCMMRLKLHCSPVIKRRNNQPSKVVGPSKTVVVRAVHKKGKQRLCDSNTHHNTSSFCYRSISSFITMDYPLFSKSIYS